MTQRRFFAFVLLAVVAWLGCRGGPVSMTAQRGSSILVAVDSSPSMSGDFPKVGYGTPDKPDVQRGRLDFFLDSPSNPLTLRSTTLVAPAPSSPIARSTTDFYDLHHPNQVTSLLDIPETAPLGEHILKVRHVPYVPPGQTESPGVTRAIGNLWVLPATLTFTDGGTTYSVDGTPTPVSTHGLPLYDSELERTIPDPQLIIPLPETEETAYAVELLVAFPTSLAEITDAGEFRTDRTTDLAWGTIATCATNCWGGSHTIKVVAIHDSGIQHVSIAFRLTGTTALNPATIQVRTLLARDVLGAEIPGFPEGNALCNDCLIPASTFVVR